MQQRCPSKNTTSCNCGISTVSTHTAPEEPAGRAQQRHRHLVNELQLQNIYGFLNSPDHEDRLRVNTGMSTTLTSEDCAPVVAQQRECQTRSKNGTSRISTVILHSLHCGNTSLEHNWKVHHSVDELELGHVIEEELLELVAAWSQGRTNRRAAPERRPLRPAPPPAPSGNPLWGSRAPPLCTRLWGPRVRGSLSRRR